MIKILEEVIKERILLNEETVLKKLFDKIKGWSEEDIKAEIDDTSVKWLQKYMENINHKSARRMMSAKEFKFYELAIDKLKNAGVDVSGIVEEYVLERELTDDEKDRKEELVKEFKKDLESWKDRYGDEAESMMYSTATKMAKEGK